MDKTPEEPRDATAYHEAGHAVMALALGRPVACVSILPDRRFLGVCEFGKAVFRPSEDWLEREILIALAGIAAEARHTGEYAWDAADRDRAYALGLAAERAGSYRKAERLLRRLLSKAEYLLGRAENWPAVEKLAAELLRLGEVSGRAARHFFEASRKESR
jgi:ATP-dependent Zn protease